MSYSFFVEYWQFSYILFSSFSSDVNHVHVLIFLSTYLSLIDVMYVSCLYFMYFICLCSPSLVDNKISTLYLTCNDKKAFFTSTDHT